MNRSHLKAWVLTSSIVSTWLCAQPIAAQVIPDTTLPAGERSQVTGNPNFQVDGGAVRGSNLFHSFSEFSIPTGGSAFFNNAPTIANIFSRITGTSVSNIDGLIQANGTANLFLLNPNGILFGPNASLNLGGSFVASTADRIQFDNGFAFSASNPQTPPLLTVSVPIGLQYGSNPGSIRGQGQLQVNTGQTLALVGGEVALEGGSLEAAGGRIELGSVAGNSLIALTPDIAGWGLSYAGVTQFQDIGLTQGAIVDTSGSGGGSIWVQGRRLTLTDGSQIFSATQGTQAGKDITIHATESVEVIGFNPQNGFPSLLTTQADPGSIGNAGNLIIETGVLRVVDSAEILTITYGAGKSGDLTVRSQSVEMSGFEPVDGFPSRLSTQTDRTSTGNAGNLTIETGKLRMTDGAQIASDTFGAGKGGDLTVRAQSVEVIGFNSQIGLATRLSAQANRVSTGNAGNLTIEAGTLRVADGAQASVSTFSTGNGGDLTVRAQSVEVIGFAPAEEFPSRLSAQANRGSTGNAGNLTIEAGTLRVADGAQVTTVTFGAGNGGDLTVRAQSVEVIGFDPVDGALLTAQTASGSTGNAGNIVLTTDRLRIANRGEIRTTSLGEGSAGNITIRSASQITLTDKARINSNTSAGQGNITLDTPLLLLRGNSSITTNATGDNIPGGNIAINSRFLVAVPQENSDISANSEDFRGGNVRINAVALYGIQPRPFLTPLSDITATGATSALPGTIEVTTAGLDPTTGLVQLPTDVVDPGLIAQGCPANEGNSFVITSRGGLPPTPEQQLDDDAEWQDRRRITVAQQRGQGDRETREQGEPITNSLRISPSPRSHSHTSITEATGWQISPTGETFLIATLPNPVMQNQLNQPTTCLNKL